MHPLLEALAVLLHAEGLPARTPLPLLAALHLHALRSHSRTDSLVNLGEVTALLVATVHAFTVLIALQTRREALTIQLHAFGVPAVTHLLLRCSPLSLHTRIFKFKFSPGTNSPPPTYIGHQKQT